MVNFLIGFLAALTLFGLGHLCGYIQIGKGARLDQIDDDAKGFTSKVRNWFK
jgi:hypothetical protein